MFIKNFPLALHQRALRLLLPMSSRKITATDSANRTNFGGVYGHTLTYSEPDTDNLLTIDAADPTGLLVATPVEGDPSRVTIREYKGY